MVASTEAVATPFAGIDEVQSQLAGQQYVCDRRVRPSSTWPRSIEKPMLVEGPAGVGKTELAQVLAAALGRELIRLQCYEGLDEAKALYEWEYAKQLLYTQLLRDKIGEVVGDRARCARPPTASPQRGRRSSRDGSSSPRPLLRALTRRARPVLLIDEIDKADPEFEAFLLEVLADFQVTIPELGTLKARHPPLVVLTSNNAREMSDALKRRCLHLYIDFPTPGRASSRSSGSGARASPSARRARSSRSIQRAPQDRAEEVPEHQRDARLGAGARRGSAPPRTSRPT